MPCQRDLGLITALSQLARVQDGAVYSNGAQPPEVALKSAADEDYTSADLDKRLHSEVPTSQRASLADILESRYLLGLEPSTFA